MNPFVTVCTAGPSTEGFQAMGSESFLSITWTSCPHYAKMLQPEGAAIQGGPREGNNQFSWSLIIHMNHFLNIFTLAKLGPRDSITA